MFTPIRQGDTLSLQAVPYDGANPNVETIAFVANWMSDVVNEYTNDIAAKETIHRNERE